MLQVRPGQLAESAAATAKARPLVAVQWGFQSIEVRLSSYYADHYLLLIKWERIDSHRGDRRRSSKYQQWRALLQHFYDSMWVVNYYGRSILP
ncbi:MAG: antibiotic biosynthesis monooxygenase [Sphingomonadales bacterium]|jgi:heme-degrading monooxygenase HmoA|nr:antibiotic biosynthesis monooxygenase [Sphingomonadales bacterium]